MYLSKLTLNSSWMVQLNEMSSSMFPIQNETLAILINPMATRIDSFSTNYVYRLKFYFVTFILS